MRRDFEGGFMRRDLMNLRRVGVLVLLATVLTIGGCSDNSVLGPDQNETSGLGRINPFTSAIAQSVLPEQSISIVETAMTIDDRAGGVIPISVGNYNHSFTVKPGALNSDQTISVKVQHETVNGKNAVSFEFGPNGLVFNEASKLNFDMAEINARALSAKLYYFDPLVQNWVLQAQGQVVRGHVIFDIYHFSKYAISD
jgi:hypothetical protein